MAAVFSYAIAPDAATALVDLVSFSGIKGW
jgi:hypothetical protein